MLMKKLIFILLCSIFVLCGCKNTEQDVNNNIVHFYKNHQSNYRNVDRKLLSEELNVLLEKAIAREVFEADWTAKSAHLTDKPFFIEADVFASHLEGEFSYAVNKITVNGNKANVVMDLTSTFVATNSVEKWTEEVVMVNENGWKVDDIIYPKGDGYLDGNGTLKKVFSDYINSTEAEAHPS
jgi:uncharacterized lipoprotein NlpE involved in copper resistance